jgi:hypothetical protein
MKWVTREKAKVDRIACPWVINRFVDKEAEFFFVPKEQVLKFSRDHGAIAFDTPGAELMHYEEDGYEFVSFDAVIKKYGLRDPALLELAKIVRSADAEPPDARPEGAGLEAAALGFRMIAKDDHENMKLQFPMYDALYAYCKWKIDEGGRLEHSK